MPVAELEPAKRRALLVQLSRDAEREQAAADPVHLLRHVRCIDNTTGDRFQFHDPGWEWQQELVRWWLREGMTLILKARQLGITWAAAGLALWYLLYKPGARVLVQSKNEDDAADVVDHVWEMFLSLALRELEDGSSRDYSHLRNGVVVQKPGRNVRPHLDIEFLHADGRVSQLNAMASTAGAGHGRTAALVILDEFSRHPYAREAWKAVVPAAGGGATEEKRAKVIVISTANGVSNEQTGEGNFYHHLWTQQATYGLATKFLPWNLNPERDEAWYQRVAMKLPARDRGEQYPLNELEAFILSGDVYFDPEALAHYAEQPLQELFRGLFIEPKPGAGQAVFERRQHEQAEALIRVFQEPLEGRAYAIAADVATGRGLDYSAAHVIDLSTMKIVAHLHGRIDADTYARQLHYLGRWYNTALIAPEMGGGYGEPIIVFLKDGKDGRPPYPRLYRHRAFDRHDRPQRDEWGFPMTTRTRPLVIGYLEKVLRERELEAIDAETLAELRTFVHAKTTPSPRAQEGTNDDRVLSLAIALELYRQRGHHERQKPRTVRRRPYRLRHYQSVRGGDE